MIRTIIVDDQKLERLVLRSMIEQHSNIIKVVDEAEGVQDAYLKIKKHEPDLIFLDVQMEDGTGFDLLSKFSNINFKIIFVTTHQTYALEAIKYAALDYLLKPINLDDFLSAVNKLQDITRISYLEQQVRFLLEKKSDFEKIALPTTDGLIFVKTKEILRCESDGSYTTIILKNNKKIIVTRILKEFEEVLPNDLFFRIHKSHLVNIEHIKEYSNKLNQSVIMENDDVIPVARLRKEAFLNIFKNLSF